MEQNFLNVTRSILETCKKIFRDIQSWKKLLDDSFEEESLQQMIERTNKEIDSEYENIATRALYRDLNNRRDEIANQLDDPYALTRFPAMLEADRLIEDFQNAKSDFQSDWNRRLQTRELHRDLQTRINVLNNDR
jgi:hypothetical protein